MSTNSSGCLRTGLIILLLIVAFPGLITVLTISFGLLAGLFGMGVGLLGAGTGLLAAVPFLGAIMLPPAWTVFLVVCLLIILCMPIGYLLYLLIHFMRTSDWPSWRSFLICLLLWLASIVGLLVSCGKAIAGVGDTDMLFQQLQQLPNNWAVTNGADTISLTDPDLEVLIDTNDPLDSALVIEDEQCTTL